MCQALYKPFLCRIITFNTHKPHGIGAVTISILLTRKQKLGEIKQFVQSRLIYLNCPNGKMGSKTTVLEVWDTEV